MFTNDDALAAKLRSFAFHGKGETQYDNIHVGLNSRLDTLQAAILIEKLAILEDEMVARQAVAEALRRGARRRGEGGAGSGRQPLGLGAIRDRDARARRAEGASQEKGIPSVIYYVKPLHQQVAYRNFPRAERLAGLGNCRSGSCACRCTPISRRTTRIGSSRRSATSSARIRRSSRRNSCGRIRPNDQSPDRTFQPAAGDEMRVGEIRIALGCACHRRAAGHRAWGSSRRRRAARRRPPPYPIPWCGRNADRHPPRRRRQGRISATSRPKRSRRPRGRE